MTTINPMTNNTTEPCEVCGNIKENLAEVSSDNMQWCDVKTIYICEACVHQIYAHTCSAFNVRPAKLF